MLEAECQISLFDIISGEEFLYIKQHKPEKKNSKNKNRLTLKLCQQRPTDHSVMN